MIVGEGKDIPSPDEQRAMVLHAFFATLSDEEHVDTLQKELGLKSKLSLAERHRSRDRTFCIEALTVPQSDIAFPFLTYQHFLECIARLCYVERAVLMVTTKMPGKNVSLQAVEVATLKSLSRFLHQLGSEE